MKGAKRNIMIITVLLFVCAAVYLNWSYNNRWGTADSEMAAAEDAMSPLKVLSRGYAFAETGGRVVKSTADVKAGDALDVTVSDGSLGCRVEAVRKRKA